MPRTTKKPPTPPNGPPATAANAASVDPLAVLTLAEAAAYLRISTQEVLRLVREQQLPGRQVGDDWRFLTAGLQDWLRTPGSSSVKEAFWRTHFGALSGDPYLEDMLAEIYKQRGRPEATKR